MQTSRSHTPRRSVLYVPADRPRAMAKAETLGNDAAIFDLEDAVAPEAKNAAREGLRRHFAEHPSSPKERVIRINALDTQWGTEDLLAARACMPDAILLPKVEAAGDLVALADALAETDAPPTLKLWAMIETPRAVINAARIAEKAQESSMRLDCFVIGTNDLFAAARLPMAGARDHAHGWLMAVVLAARAGGIDVLDGVFNDHNDADGFAAECAAGAAMGFDGKTLIHPAQIAAANAAFAPDAQAVAAAQRVVDAFALPENRDKGVIVVDGRMVERLHRDAALALIARHGRIAQSDAGADDGD
ncbi:MULTISPECIES: CoA ester lyase [unclassified Roseitalea]|uniref:HpcH/HpaI aldolase/citrate lyase family protein n=1 Tax=unclassified Roseitalea TaxID=2639107 RepID=UPI00273DFF4E|nr:MULTISPECIES: CoA ester lyase [unclassified Roseitalea]